MSSERVRNFWGTDIDQIERSYLGGIEVTDLPVRLPDARVPNQGSVLKTCVNIDQVVSAPSWLAVAFAKCKIAVTTRPGAD